MTRSTFPRVPLSSPAITWTTSSFRRNIAVLSYRCSNDFGREGHDLHVLGAEFTGHRAEDARAAGVVFRVEQHQRVAVEADVAAVLAAGRHAGANDHALDHVAL